MPVSSSLQSVYESILGMKVLSSLIEEGWLEFV